MVRTPEYEKKEFQDFVKPDKVHDANRSPEVHKLITAIELNHTKIARELAFSESFICLLYTSDAADE